MLSAALTACAAAHGQGSVARAGALRFARTNHSATLLNDGRVLVAGGRGTDALSTLASAEVFSPLTKTWSLSGSLSQGRSHHTATLLRDGRVLVTGGSAHEVTANDGARFVALASAEIFEPRSSTWRAVMPMLEARNGHTATLLDDGQVLVVGGAKAQREHLASTELFDPVANAFRPGPPLQLARWQHEAVKLSDGSVAVIAGRSNQVDAGVHGSGRAVAEVERYVDGGWQVLASLAEPRQRAATISRGNEVVVIGGVSTTTATNAVETWAVGAGGWSLSDASLTLALSAHTASVLPNGDVVVIGGEPPNAVDTARVQRWFSSSAKWCMAGALLVSRKQHTATVLKDGTILVVGGTSAGVPEASTEWWRPAKGECHEPAGLQLDLPVP